MRSSTSPTANPMGTQKIRPLIVALAFPSIIAQVINILYNIVDRMYVGHMPETGSLALTALGVSSPLILLISAFASFAMGGGAPLSAMALGRGDTKEAEKILGNCAALLLLLGIALAGAVFFFCEKLLLLFGASAATLPYALGYMRIYLCGTLFVMTSLGLNAFITCQGHARTAMTSVIIGALTNILLDPLFIFGLGMGVQGAALATVISQALSAAFVLRFLLSEKSALRLRRSAIRLEALRLGKILSLGISSFIIYATEGAISILFNAQLQHFGGDLYVGSMTILQSVMQLLVVPVSGYTHGVQPIVSYNYGARQKDRIKQVLKISVSALLLVSASYVAWVFIAPGLFARIFTKDTALVALVQKTLPIYMAGMSIFSIQMCAQMFFVGTGQAKISLFIAIFRKVLLLIPFILVFPGFWGVMGIYYAEPVADILSVLVCSILLVVGVKKMDLKPL